MTNPRWADQVPDPATWRPPLGRHSSEAVLEQDIAAGGHAKRRLACSSGHPATASVELKVLPKSRRVYAYLRYAQGGKTINTYIGRADGDSRAQRLRTAWQQVHAKAMLSAR
jgi:DNA mismatch endonuclease (patch repair protein)